MTLSTAHALYADPFNRTPWRLSLAAQRFRDFNRNFPKKNTLGFNSYKFFEGVAYTHV